MHNGLINCKVKINPAQINVHKKCKKRGLLNLLRGVLRYLPTPLKEVVNLLFSEEFPLFFRSSSPSIISNF